VILVIHEKKGNSQTVSVEIRWGAIESFLWRKWVVRILTISIAIVVIAIVVIVVVGRK